MKIAEVDCTKNKETCDNNDVTGYPTMKLFKLNGEEKSFGYRLTTDLSTLTEFINGQSESLEPVKEETHYGDEYDEQTEDENTEDDPDTSGDDVPFDSTVKYPENKEDDPDTSGDEDLSRENNSTAKYPEDGKGEPNTAVSVAKGIEVFFSVLMAFVIAGKLF